MRRCAVALIAALVAFGGVQARVLTFEDRVRAQEQIERVYHAHQIGATQPFEAAMPRDLIERKVRKYLRQTAALETFWRMTVTPAMLNRELERMAAGTRMPERLRELYAALGNDPVLIRECLARPALVDRLTRNFFAYDSRWHGETRRSIESVRDGLLAGHIDPGLARNGRSEIEAVLVTPEAAASARRRIGATEPPRSRLELSQDQFAQYRAALPAVDGIGPVAEERDAFVVRVVRESQPARLLVARYVVPKLGWNDWWRSVEDDLDGDAVAPDLAADTLLPMPGPDVTSAAVSACPPDDVWVNGSLDEAPETRTGHTAVWTGSVMIVWGGVRSSLQNGGGRYDPATDTWASISTSNAPTARRNHTAVWTGSRMVVWGGFDDTGGVASGGQYDPDADSWTPTSMAGAPQGRTYHTAVWTGSVMVVWGGYGPVSVLNTGGRYNPATDTWQATSTTGAPSARYGHTAVVGGSIGNIRVVIWGGRDVSGSLFNTGGRYDPAADTWSATSTISAPTPRSGHSAVWMGLRMIVWGGYDGTNAVNTGNMYDPGTNLWTAISTTNAPAARYDHSAVWTGTRMVIWGGSPDSNTGGRYDPFTNTWTATTLTNAPSARSGHTAVWTNAFMLVWGDGWFGGRYDPGNDAWTVMAADVPSPREYHTTVWTGTVMIVWGGGPAAVSTGSRYDPAIDAWTATTLTDAPSPRYLHSAVWTGTRMVVWGGGDGSFLQINTGGRYDPATDSWTPTSTVNAPAGRTSATAVWTGSVMVVWGGGTSNTGGRYNPASDTWAPTSTINAPTARSGHTAIWTGSRMVVWGGRFNDTTGGRYDPASDTWTPTSTVNVPAGRAAHTAVWTGSVMVVWGGWDGGSYLNTGSRYDPASNTWTPTSTIAAPAPRDEHSAVWTGNLMIVWGGRPGSGLSDGGKYSPLTDHWTSTTEFDAPEARHNHGAVWDGSGMIVWGGRGGGAGYPAAGGRYIVGDDADADGVTVCEGDCDATNATVFPGATELCDGLDNDCDGAVPGGEADGDGDSFRICAGDCDDGNAARFPGNPEVCDGLDNDCDGAVPPEEADPDADTVRTCTDNCPDTANTDQRDADIDGIGDACDASPCPPPIAFVLVRSGPIIRLARVDLATGASALIGPSLVGATDLALEPTEAFLYAVDPTRNLVIKIETATGNQIDTYSGLIQPAGIAISADGRSAYIAEAGGGRGLVRLDLASRAVTTLNSGLGDAQDVAVNSGLAYMVDGSAGRIFVVNLTTGAGGLHASGLSSPRGIVLDGGRNAAYVTENLSGELSRVHLLTRAVSVIASGLGAPGGVALDPSRRWIFMAENGGAELWRYDLATGVLSSAAASLDAPRGVAVPHIACAGFCQDSDGDGYGPLGDSSCAGGLRPDCDDADAATHPNAPEINDGLDNQCAGEAGSGSVDEVTGSPGFNNPGDPQQICWPAQGGATSYEILRSSRPDFASDCVLTTVTSACHTDSDVPPFGSGFFFLVRALTPNPGSWGQDSSGQEHVPACL